MNYVSAQLIVLEIYSKIGDRSAINEIKRRETLLNSLRRQADHLDRRPTPNNKRSATIQERNRRILKKKIKALTLGFPVSSWPEMTITEACDDQRRRHAQP